MNFGSTLKKIRIEKGIKQKDICEGIITLSYYSRIERNISEPSIYVFVRILNKLSISFDEFMFIHNNYQEPVNQQMWTYISDLYHSGNAYLLNQVKEEINMKASDKEQQILLDIIDMFLFRLGETTNEVPDSQLIVKRLMEIENWTSYEVKLFTTVMDALPIDTLIIIVNHLLKKRTIYMTSKGYNSPYNKILINVTLLCLNANYINEAKIYLCEIKKNLEVRDFYGRSFYRYLDGIFNYLTGKTEEGTAAVNDFFNICHILELDNFSKKYKLFWKNIKKRAK